MTVKLNYVIFAILLAVCIFLPYYVSSTFLNYKPTDVPEVIGIVLIWYSGLGCIIFWTIVMCALLILITVISIVCWEVSNHIVTELKEKDKQ